MARLARCARMTCCGCYRTSVSRLHNNAARTTPNVRASARLLPHMLPYTMFVVCRSCVRLMSDFSVFPQEGAHVM